MIVRCGKKSPLCSFEYVDERIYPREDISEVELPPPPSNFEARPYKTKVHRHHRYLMNLTWTVTEQDLHKTRGFYMQIKPFSMFADVFHVRFRIDHKKIASKLSRRSNPHAKETQQVMFTFDRFATDSGFELQPDEGTFNTIRSIPMRGDEMVFSSAVVPGCGNDDADMSPTWISLCSHAHRRVSDPTHHHTSGEQEKRQAEGDSREESQSRSALSPSSSNHFVIFSFLLFLLLVGG